MKEIAIILLLIAAILAVVIIKERDNEIKRLDRLVSLWEQDYLYATNDDDIEKGLAAGRSLYFPPGDYLLLRKGYWIPPNVTIERGSD